MSDLLRGSAREILYVKETTAGVTPANPTMKPLRCLPNASFKRDAAKLETKEVTTTRQKRLPRSGKVSASAEIPIELSFDTYTDFLAAVLEFSLDTFTTAITLAATTISASAVDNSFNDSAAGFVAAGFVEGDLVYGVGFSNSANNGLFKITSLTTSKMIVTGAADLVTETAGESLTIMKPAYMIVGETLKTFTLEDRFTDLTSGAVGLRFPGMVVDKLSVKIGTEALVEGTFSLIGRDGIVAETVVGTTIAAVAADQSFTDSANGFGVFKAGDVIAVSGFSTTANNGRFTVASVSTDGNKITTTAVATIENESATPSVTVTTKLPAASTSMSTTDQFAGIDDGHLFYEGGAAIAVVSDLSFDLTNNCQAYYAVTDTGALDVLDMVFMASGTMSILVKDLALMKKFIAETTSSLEFALVDPAGNKLRFIFPYIRYTGAPLTIDGVGAIKSDMPWDAAESPEYGTTLIIIREAA
ncbi:MAG: hypothetical protein KQJ78_07705 [Deltaproteobacteria bacterium]|nr:hypothetical protein [Deltaproteobacteria bacterium]